MAIRLAHEMARTGEIGNRYLTVDLGLTSVIDCTVRSSCPHLVDMTATVYVLRSRSNSKRGTGGS
ncbi:hypothetical protein J6590_005894 [Homalodisca vitripennis]|nr:hypothetical protein J6590_005894 [Homalodisca vitripennis]